MITKLKCIVIDDEPLAREGIAGYVTQVPFLDLVGICDSAISAMALLKIQKVDLMYLDIQMPSLTGLDFIKTIENPPRVIFTTAYSNYAIQGFELNAIDYLLKPISFDRFLKASNKAYDAFTLNSQKQNIEKNEEFFFIKTDKKILKIYFDDILYIESLNDYVKIFTQTERHLVLLNMKAILTYLSETKFMRIHKSFVISLNKIDSIDGNLIKIGNTSLTIGRDYKDKINQFIQTNLVKRSGTKNINNDDISLND